MMLIEPLANKMPPVFQSGLIGLIVPMEQLASLVIQTLVFAIIGVLIFALAFWIIVKATPFSVRKEIEEDHNVAIAIVIGAVILGIALVIAAAIQG
jgi:putative membrane protein